MGLFSKKKESHTIEEAIKNDDEKFSYTTQSGHTYDDFPFLMRERLYQKISASSFDDAFEMYAPHFMGIINRIDKNMELLIQQNQLLQAKCDRLEKELNYLKSNTGYSR